MFSCTLTRFIDFVGSSLEKEIEMPIDWSADVNLLTDRREQILIQHLSTFVMIIDSE